MSSCSSVSTMASLPIITDETGFQGISHALYQEIKALPSVTILEKFKELGNIRGIAFVGSSAAGKTTVINSVREAISQSPDVVIPKRYITRPQRLGDDLTENLHISVPDFKKKVETGEVTVSWERHMEGNRIEHYGFEGTDKRKLALYSANNDFFRRVDLQRHNILVIGVYAPDEVRQQRLLARSPDMKVEEARYRLGDSSENIIPFSHILLRNFDEMEKTALQDVCAVVQAVSKHRLPWGQMKDLKREETLFQSRLFEIVDHDVLFSDGKVQRLQYAERSPGVRSLLTHDGKILLTKEWREEIGGWDFRLPGGKVFENVQEYRAFQEQHPQADACAQEAQKEAAREIGEEVGIEINPDELSFAHLSKCGTSVRWDLMYFSAELKGEILPPREMVTKESEVIQHEWVPFEEVKQLCIDGLVSEDRTSNFLLKFVLTHQS